MTTIYLADLDSRIVNEIVENEDQASHIERTFHAYHILLDAFRAIAGEEVDIGSTIAYYELTALAEKAAQEWSERYGSVSDRRVVFIKMFPHAEEIIDRLKTTPAPPNWQEVFDDLDEIGYPSSWSTELRLHALQNNYEPSRVLQNHPFTLGPRDIRFLEGIMESYNKNNP